MFGANYEGEIAYKHLINVHCTALTTAGLNFCKELGRKDWFWKRQCHIKYGS